MAIIHISVNFGYDHAPVILTSFNVYSIMVSLSKLLSYILSLTTFLKWDVCITRLIAFLYIPILATYCIIDNNTIAVETTIYGLVYGW